MTEPENDEKVDRNKQKKEEINEVVESLIRNVINIHGDFYVEENKKIIFLCRKS